MALHFDQDDIKLLAVLQEFPCLPVPHIAELYGDTPRPELYQGKEKLRYPIRKRLRTLRDAGYIMELKDLRPRVGEKNRHYVYALAAKGHDALVGSPYAMRLTNNAKHDLGACLTVASFKLGIIANGLRYIDPTEFLGRSKCPYETKISESPFAIPVKYWHRSTYVETMKKHDWHPFGIGHTFPDGFENKIYFAGIEYDRDSEGRRSADAERSSIERHLRMILALHDDGYINHFGIRTLFVPVVTSGPIERWLDVLNEITDKAGSRYILFRHMPDWDLVSEFPKADGHMLMGEWQRAGHEPFNIYNELTKEKATA